MAVCFYPSWNKGLLVNRFTGTNIHFYMYSSILTPLRGINTLWLYNEWP